ncbi:MAG: hypothetical protein EOM54_05090 [Clostridia bacterium]|nr:hypothetical protein [Clostridia bacterium]
MKEEKRIMNVLGQVDEKYIEEATPCKKVNSENGKLLRFWKTHTVAACICLIALLSFMTFSTALAVSADFREMVFEFFHISTPEVVFPVEDEPQQVNDVEGIYSSDIEDTASVEYVRIDGDFDFGNGIIYLYNDEMRTSVSFYAVENDELILLDTRREETQYIWNGTAYNICFDWCVHENSVGTYGTYKEPADDAYWTVTPIRGRADIVLLTLSSGRQDKYRECILFYDLKTGSVTDPFADCGTEKLSIINTEFSPNMQKALLATDHGKTIWYCDIEEKALMTVDSFTGKDIDGSWFVDSDTICYYTMDAAYQYTYYTKSLSTGNERVILQNVPLFGAHDSTWGVRSSGGRFGVFVSEDERVYSLDFKTGVQTLIAGYTYPTDKNTRTIPNSDGDKIAFVTYNNDTTGLGISQIGVLDLKMQTFTLLDREGYEVRHEAAVSWFDNDRVVIWAVTNDYGYLYLYHITYPSTTNVE